MTPELVNRLYESAFIPECWPDLLGELAAIAKARSGWIAVANGSINFHAASDDVMHDFLRANIDDIPNYERWRRAQRANHAGFLVEKDIYTEEELKRDPVYQNIIYPSGLGHAAATMFRLPTGDELLISLERRLALGPVEREALDRLDALRPHIGRAILIAARLRLEHARAASLTLAALGLPALVLDAKGKVLAANDLIETLGDVVNWQARDRVLLKDRAANRLFAEALARIGLTANAGVRSFPLRAIESNSTMIAHVLPVRLSARDIFARGDAVLILTSTTAPSAPAVEVLQSLFDLTPAESRIARRFAFGATIDDVSQTSGVSRNTVRAHLRSIMDKTGCSRQAEIVALLSGIPSFPTGGSP
ncbi:MAG: helix-turn-helix transcriptional regulator [Methylocystis sp.]